MSSSDINIRIAENLNRYMAKNNVTQLELAEYMNVSQATISNWCKGIKMPRMDKIDRICKYFNINRSDLMDSHTLSDSLEGITNVTYPTGKPVPILGTICAGNGIWCEENFEGNFFVDESIKADLCVRVKGDSMIDAGIYNGDIAFIKKVCEYESGKIYAVRINSDCEAVLKKVTWSDDTIVLSPCNSSGNFTPIITTTKDVSIIGEFIGVYHIAL